MSFTTNTGVDAEIYLVYEEVNDETWSSTTFLILASISGVTLPVEISSRSGPWVAFKCERNSASHAVILSTGMESSCVVHVSYQYPT
jgi:hypothetical protein